MIIRSPAVAGILYEADTYRLLAQIESWLAEGDSRALPRPPKALIAPHAGYPFSGTTAAAAYRLLEPIYDSIRRVVILGTSHSAPTSGLWSPRCDIFRTPLGDVPIDHYACRALLERPEVQELDVQHDLEHSIEMQLPFLQTALDSFTLIPLLVGECSATALADILTLLWGGSETLFVVSTGLSRNLSYSAAIAQDERTAQRIRSFDNRLGYQEACGFNALNGFLLVAQRKGLEARQVALTTSAEMSGQKQQVRGCGAFVFY
ncbi:AmmeMemoRadiSam system protein B [Reinekea sp.]|jgi:AmmeMemoRadiSam system protein B|uniref:AmmeMemoRadiSam system protein B n=1 Tax=Reinekea sp. TaxID=1970455 RepID=UPI002A82EEA5|nr:AmmeMemoRadiSam system protein B [Reinekea sp.]